MNHHRSKRRTRGRSRRKLAKLMREVGIDESRNLSLEEYTMLAAEAAQGGLTVEQIDQLVEAWPKFAQTNREAIENLKQIAAGAQASQQSALRAAEHTLVSPWHPQGALAEAARCADSDEARVDIADSAAQISQQNLEGVRTIERMNQDNNRLWQWISGAAVAVAAIAAVTVVGVLFLAAGDDGSD